VALFDFGADGIEFAGCWSRGVRPRGLSKRGSTGNRSGSGSLQKGAAVVVDGMLVLRTLLRTWHGILREKVGGTWREWYLSSAGEYTLPKRRAMVSSAMEFLSARRKLSLYFLRSPDLDFGGISAGD